MNPQSLNRYAYVDNNPASFNDPTGLSHFLVYAPACPEGDFACGGGMDGGGGGGFDTNPGDPCAYVSSSDGQAACQLPPGLWNNGEPIFLPYPGGYGGGGGSIGGGGTAAGAPPAGQPPLGGMGDANRWVSPTLTPPESYCAKYGIPGLGGLGDSNMPCFAILVTSSATFGGYVPNAPGPGAKIGNGGVVPTHNYWDYLGCVATVLPAKAVGNADTAGVTLALHLAALAGRRANPYLLPVAAIYDLNIELQTRYECSREVYGSH